MAVASAVVTVVVWIAVAVCAKFFYVVHNTGGLYKREGAKTPLDRSKILIRIVFTLERVVSVRLS